jgi:hypothetical protein
VSAQLVFRLRDLEISQELFFVRKLMGLASLAGTLSDVRRCVLNAPLSKSEAMQLQTMSFGKAATRGIWRKSIQFSPGG